MAQTTSDSILGGGSEGILDSGSLKFSSPLLTMGHKGNRCKTEDGAAI